MKGNVGWICETTNKWTPRLVYCIFIDCGSKFLCNYILWVAAPIKYYYCWMFPKLQYRKIGRFSWVPANCIPSYCCWQVPISHLGWLKECEYGFLLNLSKAVNLEPLDWQTNAQTISLKVDWVRMKLWWCIIELEFGFIEFFTQRSIIVSVYLALLSDKTFIDKGSWQLTLLLNWLIFNLVKRYMIVKTCYLKNVLWYYV